jgi:hypothetical protein
VSGRVIFPPGVDGWPYLSPFFLPDGRPHPLWTARPEWSRNGSPIGGTLYRHTVTRDSPLRFGLTYLRPFLTNRHTGVIALSDAHLAMARAGLALMHPYPQLDAWVLPRGFAKTTWLYVILPAWALAHGHRKFFLSFALTKDQAEGHLAKLRHQLDVNELLLGDFPGLRKLKGSGASNTKATVTTSGATLAARALTGQTAGMSDLDGARPDAIVGDDVQPEPADFTAEAKVKIESRIVNKILPMGDETTVVTLAGTTVGAGCLMDDVVRAALPVEHKDHRVAPWISAHQFTPHYFPAILDEGTPYERSLWPQRRSLEWLRRHREQAPQDYALNFSNRPEEAGARGYWQREHIRYDERLHVVRRLLYADVAMTQRAKSDETVIILLGVTADGRTAVVEHTEAGRFEGRVLRDRMWQITAAYPGTLHEWYVEGNQGRDRWLEIISPVPAGVELVMDNAEGHKADRIIWALAQYQRRAVFHRHPLTALEEQMLAWTPTSRAHDDRVDALAGALKRAALVGAVSAAA